MNVALRITLRKKEQYKGRKLLYVVFDECLILPLVINQRKKEITLLGHGESSDYLSFLYMESIIQRFLQRQSFMFWINFQSINLY